MIGESKEEIPSDELSPQTYKELVEVFQLIKSPIKISENITLKPQGKTLAIVSLGENGEFLNSKTYTLNAGKLFIARLDAETIKKMNPDPEGTDLLFFDPDRTDQLEYLSEAKALELLKFLRSLV